MYKLKGDTLIEVALAIGIFSLVAIIVVSVISAGTSSAQSALEVTVTREDLDAQAEALRFIHDSYVSGTQSKKTTDNAYADLWNKLTRLAINESTARSSGALDYHPNTCSEVYNSGGTVKRYNSNLIPFVINPRKLNDPSAVSDILVTSGESTSKPVFWESSTFPRIIYGTRTPGSATTEEDFHHQADLSASTIQRVEGIYVIAVKDDGSPIVSGPAGNVSTSPAYYDFYIRSCWMPIGSNHASTISTVIRLYDPAAISY